MGVVGIQTNWERIDTLTAAAKAVVNVPINIPADMFIRLLEDYASPEDVLVFNTMAIPGGWTFLHVGGGFPDVRSWLTGHGQPGYSLVRIFVIPSLWRHDVLGAFSVWAA